MRKEICFWKKWKIFRRKIDKENFDVNTWLFQEQFLDIKKNFFLSICALQRRKNRERNSNALIQRIFFWNQGQNWKYLRGCFWQNNKILPAEAWEKWENGWLDEIAERLGRGEISPLFAEPIEEEKGKEETQEEADIAVQELIQEMKEMEMAESFENLEM